MSVRVSFVIVSHSASLARGVCELAVQMAPDVHFEATGGTDDGHISTSYDLVKTAFEAALATVDGEGSGVIVLTGLSSATMTVESVIDVSGEPERVHFVDTCLVEGAVVSSVRTQLDEDLDQVTDVAAALAPRVDDVPAQEAPRPAPAKLSGAGGRSPASSMWAQGDAVVADPIGPYARPAAVFVCLTGTFDAEVTVNGAGGGSVLELMALDITQGQGIHVETNGADATATVAALTDMLEGTTEQPLSSKETMWASGVLC